DGSLTRGCLTSATTCTAPACLSCTGNGCNAGLMCRKCDGSQTECATTNASANAYNELCAANQWCRNVLNDNGTVTRSCGDECAANDAKCSSCNNKDNCNEVLFPANARQCYQCTGEACNTVTDSMLKPCSVTKAEGQQCYTSGSDAKTMVRGCTTDGGATCTANTTSCLLCDTENGCNNRTYNVELNKCIKCSDADKCFGAQNAADAVACAGSNFTQTADNCYTQVFDNGTVSRGCVSELQGACDAQSDCSDCAGEACNTQVGTFTCYVCRSDNYPDCRNMKGVGYLPCTNTSLTSPESKQCYSGEWDGIVVRGCLIDLGAAMTYQCYNNADDRCDICSGINCNTEVEKYNGAATLQHMGLGMLALFFLVRNAF
ncbi:hypothetical protein KR044_010494, partial [Drosophila immigrans]